MPQRTALSKHTRRHSTSQGNVNFKKRTLRSAGATGPKQRGRTLFRVECVRQQRVVDGKVEYRVHWEGYATDQDTWYVYCGPTLDCRSRT